VSELLVAKSEQPEVLTQLSDSIRREINQLSPWLKVTEVHCGETLIMVAINPHTPLGIAQSPGGVAVVMGYGREDRPQDTAEQLLAEHACIGPSGAARFFREINFGVAVSVLQTGGTLLGTDYLGLFPLFVYESATVTIFSSAIRFMRHAPSFPGTVDMENVVQGLLLSHHLFGNTVWSNVKRLDAGQFVWLKENGMPTFEQCAYPDPTLSTADFEEHVRVCHETIQGIVNSYLLRGVRDALMSGGLDSRLIAGYMSSAVSNSSHRQGFLIGDRTDTDVRCGSRVLRSIGFEAKRLGVDSGRCKEWALQEVCWNTTESGLYGSHFWCLADGLLRSQTPVFTGLVGDAVMGTSHVHWAYDPVHEDYSFDRLLYNVSAWGFPLRVIERLVRVPDAQDIMHASLRRLRDTFESYPGDTWRKAWWFDLHHRQRFLVGRTAKLIAATSWPIMPLADYRLISLIASFPLSTLHGRKLQAQTVVRCFPKLADLPLDRNNMDTRSVRKGLQPRGFLSAVGAEASNRICGRLRRRFGLPDNRFHARMFDLNDPGWRGVRDVVRHEIPNAASVIEPAEALRIIPSGSEFIQTVGNLFHEAAARKYLMSLILWHGGRSAGA
jgi:asparagine synthetase B (glutamine-hydrolysing)